MFIPFRAQPLCFELSLEPRWMAKEKKKKKKDINLSKTYQINGQLTQALLPIQFIGKIKINLKICS
jgi:hypothetical protein